MLKLPQGSQTLQRISLVCVASLTISSFGLLVKASQVDGAILYSTFSVTLLSELFKLCVASAAWLHASFSSASSASQLCKRAESKESSDCEPNNPSASTTEFPTRTDVLRYSVPGILYVIANNIRFPMSERVNPAVIAVVWNMKIFGIAALLKFALGRIITQRQWAGIALLFVGSVLTELSQWHWHNEKGKETETQLEGLFLLAMGLVVVSFANVICEHIYKGNAADVAIPLHKQNVVLYSWGFTLNAIMWFIHKPAGDGLFDHYTHWTIAVIISSGTGGYLIGAMFKYLDSIAATFADLIAMLTTAILSAIFFDLDANFWFYVGFLISSLSIYVYYVGKSTSQDDLVQETGNGDTEMDDLSLKEASPTETEKFL
mmetsp:Transcript_22327/g.32962  ORF Transcript_22327/g.32962 Transcript_22327/m.32962 type:complete len:375 (-) Transcript_22327:41-1165(-)